MKTQILLGTEELASQHCCAAEMLFTHHTPYEGLYKGFYKPAVPHLGELCLDVETGFIICQEVVKVLRVWKNTFSGEKLNQH